MAKKKIIFVLIFFTLLTVLFVGLFGGRVFHRQLNTLKLSKMTPWEFSNIDWKERYPYKNEIPLVKEPISTQDTKKSSLSDMVSSYAHIFDTLGSILSSTFPMYDRISKLGYVINSRLSDPSVGDTYIRLKNGYWFELDKYQITDSAAQKTVAPYSSLQNYLENKGIPFLYCYAPSKECCVNNEFPAGVTSYQNDNINRYVSALKKYGVNYIDFRSNIHQEGLYHYSLFYKTDHHWTADAAIWAVGIIEDELNDRFGLQIKNIRDIGPFRREVYEKAWLGSYGRAVTKYVAEYEDFVMLYPEFETSFEMEIPDISVNKTGSFESMFNNIDSLKDAIDNDVVSMYGQVLYGNRPYIKIKNLNNPDGPRILVIKDSFGIAAAPYLALSCSELLLLDPRPRHGNFNGNIVTCINDFAPDAVLVLLFSPQKLYLNK